MTTLKNFGQLGVQFTKYSKGFGEANKIAVTEAAKIIKEYTIASAAKDVGSDLAMSHWGWIPRTKTYRQPKLSVYYDVKGKQRATALIKPKPIGLWVYLEAGAKPHPITPRKRGRYKVRALADKPKNEVFGASAQHPGTKGKKTWSRGLRVGEPVAMRVYTLTHQRELQRTATR